MTPPEKKFTLTHALSKVSSILDRDIYSNTVSHFNIPWRMVFRRRNNNSFGFLFCCEKPKTDKEWVVRTRIKLEVVSLRGHWIATTFLYSFGNEVEFNYYEAIPLPDWNSMMKNYVTNDMMVCNAHVTILEMKGINSPLNIRNFNVKEPLDDVILDVDYEKFHVSRAILSNQSIFFRILLLGEFREARQEEVVLKDVSAQDFQVFLELIHQEETLTDSNIEDVLKLVDMYDAKKAGRLCELYLMTDSQHSLRTKIRIAARYKLDKLKIHCFNDMKTHADVASVLGPDLTQLDATYSDSLHSKSLLLLGN